MSRDIQTNSCVFYLPKETIRLACSFLNARDLSAVSRTNRQFAELSEEAVLDILRSIHKSTFPAIFSPAWRAYMVGDVVNYPKVNRKRLLNRLTSNQIYVLGGAFNSDQMSCYLPLKKEWHVSAEMAQERESCCATSIRGYVVAMSGESDESTSSVEMFSPLENFWTSVPRLPCRLRSTVSVSFHDTVFIIGGQDLVSSESSSFVHSLQFDFNKGINNMNDWKSYQLLSEPRYGHSAVVFNDEIWIAGGSTADDFCSSSVESLLVQRNGTVVAGEVKPSMNNGRRQFKLLVVKGQLFAVGGDSECTIERFDCANNEWQIVTNMPSYKTNFAAATDGECIFVFGGQDKRRAFLSSSECFDVSLGRWVPGGTSKRLPFSSTGFSHGDAVGLDFESLSW